jgi:hypothetical protein
VLSGFAAARWGIAASALTLTLTIVPIWLFNQRITARTEASRRERLAYARGANGEELVGSLRGDLPDTWHVFHGLQLDPNRDIDHVAVGPGGLYCISTKNLRGLFARGPDGGLLYNGEPTSLGRQAVAQAMNVRDRLGALMGGTPYVNAVLAVPQAWVNIAGFAGNVHVLHQDNLVRTLENAPQRLDGAQVAACVKALGILAESAVNLKVAGARAQFRDGANSTATSETKPGS